jgi:predicted glycosyltransferase
MGHLVRAATLADALSRRFDVLFVSGGAPAHGIPWSDRFRVVQLPALGMGEDHALLKADDGGLSIDAVRNGRRAILLGTLDSWRPTCLLIELFPFGRKKFAFELIPLLTEARARGGVGPAVFCSVRDILVRGRNDQQDHDDRACRLLNLYFDGVLVHADARLARLDESFRPREPLAVPVCYTGFVVPRRTIGGNGARERRVIVSAGGGAVGSALYRAAVDVQRTVWENDRLPMTVVAGPYLPDADWQDLQERGEGVPGLTLIRSVPDLAVLLEGATASVSQCGYNTAIEILQTRVPALVVPYTAPGEDEQMNRARRLERLGAVRVLNPARLSAPVLAAALEALSLFRPEVTGFDIGGAQRTVEVVKEWISVPRNATHPSARRPDLGAPPV